MGGFRQVISLTAFPDVIPPTGNINWDNVKHWQWLSKLKILQFSYEFTWGTPPRPVWGPPWWCCPPWRSHPCQYETCWPITGKLPPLSQSQGSFNLLANHNTVLSLWGLQLHHDVTQVVSIHRVAPPKQLQQLRLVHICWGVTGTVIATFLLSTQHGCSLSLKRRFSH